jgi:hypothetical protein
VFTRLLIILNGATHKRSVRDATPYGCLFFRIRKNDISVGNVGDAVSCNNVSRETFDETNINVSRETLEHTQ